MGLSASKWAEVRRVWEQSPRRGYAWLIEELNLDTDATTISKRALREGWKKAEKLSADNTLDMFDGGDSESAETRPKRPRAAGRQSKGGGAKGDSKAPRKPKARKPASNAKPESAAAKRSRKRPFDKAGANGVSEDENDSGNEWVGTHDLDIPRAEFGRPKEYKPEYAKQAFKLCLLGSTDEQIADFFETSVRTIHRWKHNHPEFCHSLRRGKTEADAEVAASLFQRAIGMTINKSQVVSYLGQVKIVTYEEHVVGDVGAQKVWLYNRAPDRWKADPEPPAPALESLYPTEEQQNAIFEQSNKASETRAKEARRRRERMGMFDGSSSVPVDATVKELGEILGVDESEQEQNPDDLLNGDDGSDWERD